MFSVSLHTERYEHIMRKSILSVAVIVATILMAAGQQPQVMTKQADGTYVVNTTTICKTTGYKGRTPLEVSIKNNQVVKVVALKNQETPKYFGMVKKELLPKYEGMKVGKVAKSKVDAVTGATYSSQAVSANVKAAVEYYKKHR